MKRSSSPLRMPRPLAAAVLLVVTALIGVMTATPAEAVDKNIAVVLCHGSNQAWPASSPKSRFVNLFTSAGVNTGGLYDYWRDVSMGALSLANTTVVDTQVSTDADSISDRDKGDWLACVRATTGIDWSKMAGAVVITPQAQVNLVDAVTATSTQMHVAATSGSLLADLPTPPFTMAVGGQESVLVTARNNDILTVTRAQYGYRPDTTKPPPPAQAWPAGTYMTQNADGYGAGPSVFSINGTNYTLGRARGSQWSEPTFLAHEMGHSFGLEHSRNLATSTQHYGDCYDIMSAVGCVARFAGTYGESGPGATANILDVNGWIPATQIRTVDVSTCRQETSTMRALGLSGTELKEQRLPVTFTIPNAADGAGNVTGNTTSQYYTAELRSKKFPWDKAIAQDGFLVHVKGADGISYWDSAAGLMAAGAGYTANGRYFFVNAIDAVNGTGVITVASCQIKTVLTYTGPTSVTYYDEPLVSARLTPQGSTRPVKGQSVTFTRGTASCTATTDVAGNAKCSLEIVDLTSPINVSFAGTTVLGSSSTQANPTVNPSPTGISTYEDPVGGTYHDEVTVSAFLDNTHGRYIADQVLTFTVGSGAEATSCSATTGSGGYASCRLVINATPGMSSLLISYAGKPSYYLPTSRTYAFPVAKHPTVLVGQFPKAVGNGNPATFSADLSEHPGQGPIEGRTVTFTLGSGSSAQSCAGTTTAGGHATCTIPNVQQPADATSVSVSAAFAGDAYYLPSSQSATVKLVYYTGRAYALSLSALGLLGPTTSLYSDTGNVSTASPKHVEMTNLIALPFTRSNTLNGSVDVGGNQVVSRASSQDVTLTLAGLPTLKVGSVVATSTSRCEVASLTPSTSATTEVAALSIGTRKIAVTGAPNQKVDLGSSYKLVINEQQPSAGSAGTLVNGVHVTSTLLGVDLIISSARSAVNNCS